MSREDLNTYTGAFLDAIEQRLNPLSEEEQQQFLEGILITLDAMQRYANLGLLSPLEREKFIGYVKSDVYSRTMHKGLDSETHMTPIMDGDAEYKAKSLGIAAKVQEALGMEVDFRDKMEIEQMALVYAFKLSDEMKNASPPPSELGERKPELTGTYED